MHIKTLIKKSIGYLNIDRHESLNAMNEEVLDEFISKINDAQIETALKTLKLEDYLDHKVGTLSFGEIKKLEFLRLIIENKKVWILDEPLSNLDEDSIELMKQTFEDHCAKEGSIIFSSHHNPGIYVTDEIHL